MSHGASYDYHVYGQTFSSDRPFLCCLSPGREPASWRLSFQSTPTWSTEDWERAHRVSPPTPDQGVEIGRNERGWSMRLPELAEFTCEGGDFTGYLVDPDEAILGELVFLDCALPFALELQGVPFLHASAVEYRGRAVAFSTFAGGGKSSLTTGMTLRGHPFVTDDVLVLRPSAEGCQVYPGYPQIRLWSDSAERLLPAGTHDELHPSWPKRRGLVQRWAPIATEPLPLAAIYLVEAAADCQEVEITDVRGQAGFFQLLENSPAVAALDFQTQAVRTAQFGDLLRTAALRRIRYPRSYAALPSVLDAVLADVEALP
jgi:hypothetical protein